jgi:hypothetical protein
MNLQKLNFPDIQTRFKEKPNGQNQIFDSIRKKIVDLTGILQESNIYHITSTGSF